MHTPMKKKEESYVKVIGDNRDKIKPDQKHNYLQSGYQKHKREPDSSVLAVLISFQPKLKRFRTLIRRNHHVVKVLGLFLGLGARCLALLMNLPIDGRNSIRLF
jgi:hypothetical protein